MYFGRYSSRPWGWHLVVDLAKARIPRNLCFSIPKCRNRALDGPWSSCRAWPVGVPGDARLPFPHSSPPQVALRGRELTRYVSPWPGMYSNCLGDCSDFLHTDPRAPPQTCWIRSNLGGTWKSVFLKLHKSAVVQRSRPVSSTFWWHLDPSRSSLDDFCKKNQIEQNNILMGGKRSYTFCKGSTISRVLTLGKWGLCHASWLRCPHPGTTILLPTRPTATTVWFLRLTSSFTYINALGKVS